MSERNDDQDWLNLLAGQSVPDAHPKTVLEAQALQGALLLSSYKQEKGSEMPFPHIWENISAHLEEEQGEIELTDFEIFDISANRKTNMLILTLVWRFDPRCHVRLEISRKDASARLVQRFFKGELKPELILQSLRFRDHSFEFYDSHSVDWSSERKCELSPEWMSEIAKAFNLPESYYPNRDLQPVQDQVIQQVVNLFKWLKNDFDDAKRAGWQAFETFLRKEELAYAFMSPYKRAKPINLGDHTVLLALEIKEPDEQEEIEASLWVRPYGEQAYLPKGIKFKVIPKKEEPEEVIALEQDSFLKQVWVFSLEEEFDVTLELEGITYTEPFIIATEEDNSDVISASHQTNV
ncbi:protein containing DUF1822 [Candidatus Thiomargarita nelsonii]|uniref:Protein containing DUF1822 n=1 Tax=Candidatus Thiomargarita nelsonii TaxID=1003181 RepID=A0A0A6P193_9GAMM|nr:protein containing DUF1822 [Candidatus Thiomargarita nelsonii]